MRSRTNFFNKKGTILIISLWILVILSMLALSLAHRMSIELKLNKFYRDKTAVFYSTKAGIKKVIATIKKDYNATDGLKELWSCGRDFSKDTYLFKDVDLGQAIFTVSYIFSKDQNGVPVYFYGASDEERRLNINLAAQSFSPTPPLVLYYLFVNLGINDADARTLSDSVKDWIDTDSTPRTDGAEDEYYSTGQPAYSCHNGPIKTIYELRLVKGMSDEYFDLIKDYLTTFGSGKVNINTVSDIVLKSFFDAKYGTAISQPLTDAVMNVRRGLDGIDGTNDDFVFNDLGIAASIILGAFPSADPTDLNSWLVNNFSVRSEYFRIHSTGSIKNGRIKQEIEATINKNIVSADKVETSVVFWHEN